MFPALLLTLDEYSSWRLGRVVPILGTTLGTPVSEMFFMSKKQFFIYCLIKGNMFKNKFNINAYYLNTNKVGVYLLLSVFLLIVTQYNIVTIQ